MRNAFLLGALFLALFFSSLGSAVAETKQFIMIVDTSGSMESNDPSRYAVQAGKILSDILEPGDELAIVKFANTAHCNSQATPALAVQGKNGIAKPLIDSHLGQLDDHTHFSAPVATAAELFHRSGAERKMLLIMSDMGGSSLEQCSDTRENLAALRINNVDLTAINVGSGNLASSNNYFMYHDMANSSEELVRSVAEVYQRFIGGVKIQSGRVMKNKVSLRVNEYARHGYLVIASDGDVGKVTVDSANPGARKIDTNFRGGGATTGWDKVTRKYKIVEMVQPKSGAWSFNLPEISNGAGWMFIEDYSVSMRLVSPPVAVVGRAFQLRAELFDEITGKTIPSFEGADLRVNVDGREYTLSPDGQSFVTEITVDSPGKHSLLARLKGGSLDKAVPFQIDAIRQSWEIVPSLPERVVLQKPVQVSVTLVPLARGSDAGLPEHIFATFDSNQRVRLEKGGEHGQYEYTGEWIPSMQGQRRAIFSAQAGLPVQPVEKKVEVLGSLSFGQPIPVDFGATGSSSVVERVLDLNVTVSGRVDISLGLDDYPKARSDIEIQLENGWTSLDSPRPIALTGNRRFPVRLVVGRCPEGCESVENFFVKAEYDLPDGEKVVTSIPIHLAIIEDHWFTCWWPIILTVTLVLSALRIIYCVVTPARFPGEFGLVLSTDPDVLKEGLFHVIRSYKGARSGFCKDAFIYMHEDFRFTRVPRGAFVKLQARDEGILIIPVGNGTLWRKSAGGQWEVVNTQSGELLRPGSIYRNELKTIFFEARDGNPQSGNMEERILL